MKDWERSFREHIDTAMMLGAVLASQWDPAVTMLAAAFYESHKVLVCGEGAAAAQSASIAAQLLGRFRLDRLGLAAISLTEPAAMNSIAMDNGYQQIFSRQVRSYGKAGDVLLAISPVGSAANVKEAVIAAKHIGMGTIGISGVRQLNCDVDIAIPSNNPVRVQELATLVAHLIIEGVEERLPK